ncbi:hypothetical protein ARMSODRAFT_537194 [Armillaria solidipes]|uniref:Uncharacterized protein n=1 Tax=Armillaria solidipes TaxID=1076256 RepID=A0A2H3B921_9AGAR|nr:hypothetical protein ARMSODRAFT_537194 [Armillaria solidipes]
MRRLRVKLQVITSLCGVPLYSTFSAFCRHTRRMPDCISLSAISTGSKLCAWMKEIGELQHAKDEIAWAEQEAVPEELFPCDMATLLGDEDNRPPGVQKFIDEQFKTDGCRISSRRYLKYQNRLPLYLLPEKLIVHHPDDTLHAHTGSHLRCCC